jgi:hypothetical protein
MENNQITQRKDSDFTEEEVKSLQEWKDNNRPGLHSLTQDQAFQWFRLYMAGKTYSEIAKMTSSKKDLILFVSERANWAKMKLDHYSDISEKMLQKYKEAKIQSLNTMTTMVNALSKYFGDKFDKYLKTNDESVLESLDSKMLAQYQKANESIDKIIADITGDPSKESGSRSPTININMNGSSSIKQKDDNTVDIEPIISDDDASKILENLSKLRKIRSSQD